MTGTTGKGFPYVTPTDHPVEFPAHSQALANKLQTDVARVRGGSSLVTTDATGKFIIAHGLGVIPDLWLFNTGTGSGKPTVGYFITAGVPQTTTEIYGYVTTGASGTAYVGQIYVNWLAVAL